MDEQLEAALALCSKQGPKLLDMFEAHRSKSPKPHHCTTNQELSPLRDLVETPTRSKIKKPLVKQEEEEDWTERLDGRNRRQKKEEDKKRDRSKPSNRQALPPASPTAPAGKTSKKRTRKESPSAMVKDEPATEHPSKRLSK